MDNTSELPADLNITTEILSMEQNVGPLPESFLIYQIGKFTKSYYIF